MRPGRGKFSKTRKNGVHFSKPVPYRVRPLKRVVSPGLYGRRVAARQGRGSIDLVILLPMAELAAGSRLFPTEFSFRILWA